MWTRSLLIPGYSRLSVQRQSLRFSSNISHQHLTIFSLQIPSGGGTFQSLLLIVGSADVARGPRTSSLSGCDSLTISTSERQATSQKTLRFTHRCCDLHLKQHTHDVVHFVARLHYNRFESNSQRISKRHFMQLSDYSDLQAQPVICRFRQPQCTVLSRLMLFTACKKATRERNGALMGSLL